VVGARWRLAAAARSRELWRKAPAVANGCRGLHRGTLRAPWPSGCGGSSGGEHNLCKVGGVGSNPIARSIAIARGILGTWRRRTMPRLPLPLLLKLTAEPRAAIAADAPTADALLPSRSDAPSILIDAATSVQPGRAAGREPRRPNSRRRLV